MWTEAILERIGFRASTAPTFDTLSELQRCFMTSVAFENLDIHLGRAILLERERVLNKIVNERRGGWCFEVNEVFFTVLEALGFDVSRCASTVLLNGGDAGELHPFDHLALLVSISGRRWLVDAGFGDSSLAPLNLDSQSIQTDGHTRYKLLPERHCIRLERATEEGGWQPQHQLDPRPREWSAFAQRCAYLQSAAASKFTQKRLCTRIDDGVSLTLSGNKLVRTGVTEHVPEHHYLSVLRERFDIELVDATWIHPT